MKRKDIADSTFLMSVNYSFNVIKITAGGHVTDGLNIWVCKSTDSWVCSMSLSVYVISNQGTSKKPNMSDLSKPDALLHKTASSFWY